MKPKIINYRDMKPEVVEEPDAEGITIRILIGDKDGAPNFIMRLFEIIPGGHSMYHKHPWEHEIFIVDGDGKVKIGEEEYKVNQGTAIFIPPNIMHTIINDSNGTLRFLCLIPKLE